MPNKKTVQSDQYDQARNLLFRSNLSFRVREKILQSPISCQNILKAVEEGKHGFGQEHLQEKYIKELLDYPGIDLEEILEYYPALEEACRSLKGWGDIPDYLVFPRLPEKNKKDYSEEAKLIIERVSINKDLNIEKYRNYLLASTEALQNIKKIREKFPEAIELVIAKLANYNDFRGLLEMKSMLFSICQNINDFPSIANTILDSEAKDFEKIKILGSSEKLREALDYKLITSVGLDFLDEDSADNVEKLIKEGANPNAQLDNGITALHGAITHDNLPVVDILLKSGADPEMAGLEDETPLHLAARLERNEILRLLMVEICLRESKGESLDKLKNQLKYGSTSVFFEPPCRPSKDEAMPSTSASLSLQ